MTRLCFINRTPRPEYFSIEKVFAAVRKQLHDYEITEIAAPHSRITLRKVWQNLRFVRKSRADIYHVTGDAHYLALAVPAKRTVLTIHDCIFLKEKNFLKRVILKKLFLDLPVRHAKIITTISENSRKDIISNSGCAPEKVVVIPNPIDENIYYSEKEFNASLPVILFVGTTPNKNLPRVIQAIKHVPCVLEIVGKIPSEHKEQLEKNSIRFTESFSISASELAEKYAKSDLLLFPTLFEGFGLPIVEAQKAGRVVITSNLSPMKEVAGDGACLVDPYNPDDIRESVIKVIASPEYRLHLVKKGIENARRFSAEQTAKGYKKVYESVLAGPATNVIS